jgi:acetyltransferase
VLVSSFMGREDKALQTFQEEGIAAFDSPERAARAMAALRARAKFESRPLFDEKREKFPVPEGAEALVKKMQSEGADEFSAKALLKSYAIPITRDTRADSSRAAVRAARETGFPVVVKGLHPEVFHKTEQGLVHEDCRDENDVEQACERIYKKIGRRSFLVSEKIRSDREFMAGVARFPGFPPCLLFGLGGVFSEALMDFGLRLAPLDKNEALDLIFSVRADKMLGPFRGAPAVDTDAMADMLVRLGRLALDFPSIREIDLNPVMIDDSKPVAADALFVLRPD